MNINKLQLKLEIYKELNNFLPLDDLINEATIELGELIFRKTENLTQKQLAVYSAILNLTKTEEVVTLEKIKEFLNYKSTSAVQRHTIALKKKGLLVDNKHEIGLKLI